MKKVSEYILRFLYFAIAFACILFISYLFGHTILENPMQGNDAAFSLSQGVWIDRYFPFIPFWYPLQGAGISIVAGYPILFLLVAAAVHHLSTLTLTQVYGLVQFVAMVGAALGVYFFGWARLKNQTVGLIAAIMYLVSSMTWIWTIGAGFYAQSFSFLFVPYALLAFDVFLSEVLADKRGLKYRVSFVASVLLITFSAFAHPITAVGELVMFPLYAATIALAERRVSVWTVMLQTALLEINSLLLMLFWLYPFMRYTGASNRGMNPSPTPDLSILAIFTFRGLLGLPGSPASYQYTNFSLVPAVWVPALVTAIFAFMKNKKTVGLFVIAALSLFLSGSMLPYIVSYPFLHANALYLTGRFYTPIVMISVPLLAAYGLYSMAAIALSPVKKIFHAVPLGSWVVGVLVTVVFLLLTVGDIVLFHNMYTSNKSTFFYGAERQGYSKRTGYQLSNIWQYCTSNIVYHNVPCPYPQTSVWQQLQPKNWPPFTLGTMQDGAAVSLTGPHGVISYVPQKPFERIDISPYLGAVAKDWPVYSNVSLVNTYNFQSSLIHPMWGYEQAVFFSKDAQFANPTAVTQVAQYFGTDYLVLNPKLDPISKYNEEKWPLVGGGSGNQQTFEVRANPQPTGLFREITQPTVLVIGSEQKGAYEQLFRLATDGALPYEKGFLIEGKSAKIDDYSLAELQQFPVIVLHGYSYDDASKAWSLLQQYVSSGGSVFLDTGWQFVDKDWGTGPDAQGHVFPATLPDPSPVRSVLWQQDSLAGYHINPAFAGSLDEKQAFSGTVAKLSDLVSGATPIVQDKEGNVLVAQRQYGKGRIIWSGMNLIPLAYGRQDTGTIQLAQSVFTLLLQGRGEAQVSNQPTIARPNPDTVVFTFHNALPSGGLLFRESYYDGWQAEFSGAVKEKLPIYRGGPGFMYVPLAGVMNGNTLTLSYEKPLSEWVASFISLLTAGGLVIFLFQRSEFLQKLLEKFPISRIFIGKVGLKKVTHLIDANEEEY